jgi:hypothetical protein
MGTLTVAMMEVMIRWTNLRLVIVKGERCLNFEYRNGYIGDRRDGSCAGCTLWSDGQKLRGR